MKLALNRWLRDGRDDWIRTSDPHNPIVVRYQTAPRPVDQIRDEKSRAHSVNRFSHSATR